MAAHHGSQWLDKFCEILQIESSNVQSLNIHIEVDGVCKVYVRFVADEDVLELAAKAMAKDGTMVIGHLSNGDPKQKEDQ